MPILLTADWHLTDNPAEEYRWNVFMECEKALCQYGAQEIIIAGDLCDRKDRHSAALVNRLFAEMSQLCEWAKVTIIMGNHDAPMNGPPFWNILNNLHKLHFYAEPHRREDGLLLMPYTPKPESVDLGNPAAIIMHQPLKGAREKGREISGFELQLPTDIPIYSGDIHTPQRVGNVQYIGAPHRVRFGDDHVCQMLVLNEQTFKRAYICRIEGAPNRMTLTVSDLSDLQRQATSGDMVRVIYKLPSNRMNDWPAIEHEIHDWAASHNIVLDAIEPEIGLGRKEQAELMPEDETPESILQAYAKSEGIDGDLLEYGMQLLRETRGL